jgi:hypothetical protein
VRYIVNLAGFFFGEPLCPAEFAAELHFNPQIRFHPMMDTWDLCSEVIGYRALRHKRKMPVSQSVFPKIDLDIEKQR